jgi:DNA-binding response OmpR family regulator
MIIAIVEDDLTLARNLELILSKNGHQVVSFPSPESALTSLKLKSAMDVLIIDYNLQVFTAEYFISELKDTLPKTCKIILISGHTDIFEERDASDFGAAVYLPKPLDLDLLLDEVGAV